MITSEKSINTKTLSSKKYIEQAERQCDGTGAVCFYERSTKKAS